jgi:CheY-like chemotaxis protein
MNTRSEVFQVLVVDNDEETLDDAARHLGAHYEVHTRRASTQAEAEELILNHYFHAAILDIELSHDAPAGGIELIRRLVSTSPTTTILVGTQHHDEARVNELLALTSVPQLISVVYKDQAPDGWQRIYLEEAIDEWRRSRLSLEGVEEIVKVLRNGGRIPKIRRDDDELRRELEALLCGLFATLAPIDERGRAGVAFSSMRSAGLSSAAVFEAEPRLGHTALGNPVTGVECVVKIGPRTEIDEEVKRYDRFVRFGAHLNQRVELLSSAFEHSLGAVCYSIVGARDARVVSLDEALRDPERQSTVLETLEHLFRRESRNWYSVGMPLQGITAYFRDTYSKASSKSKSAIAEGYKHLDKSLNTLSGRCESISRYRPATNEEDGTLEIGGVKLLIPRSNVFGGAEFTKGSPACLIHGDMHGGNVLIEMTPTADEEPAESHFDSGLERVCLIDYRYSGPGPRCVDFAALETSVRYADAEAIAAETYEDASSPPSEEELDKALAKAARRQEQELALGMELWGRQLGSRRGGGKQTGFDWQVTPSAIRLWALENFDDLTLEEYVATMIAAGIRQMGYDLAEVPRLRLLAWISAQYMLLSDSREARSQESANQAEDA